MDSGSIGESDPLPDERIIPNKSPHDEQDSGSDSDSDMSTSADSDDDNGAERGLYIKQINGEDIQHSNLQHQVAPGRIDGTSKRKFSDSILPTPLSSGNLGQPGKRLRAGNPAHVFMSTDKEDLSLDESPLPCELWHHIFTFLPPRQLGKLLRVNKLFRTYLDPSLSNRSNAPVAQSVAKYLSPDAIWQASRRLYWPGMPAPLKDKSELDMWRIACSFSCQFCWKKRPVPAPQTDQWHSGPGENGVAPVWLFGIHTCGSCLEERSRKEVQLLLDNKFFTPLMTGLPVLYFSNEFHIISPTTVKNPQNQAPPAIKILKIYFKTHVDDILQEYVQVNSLGNAAADEWLKGLENRGLEQKGDAARWERWETSGGVARMRMPDPDLQEAKKNQMMIDNNTPNSLAPTRYNTGHALLFQARPSQAFANNSQPQMPNPIITSFQSNVQSRFGSPIQNVFGPFSSRAYPLPRQEKSKEEVAEMKAARRAEIERRCLLLEPPLTASVLSHMGSFQAAMQIVKPFDDASWEVLKPRILSQRKDAEEREKEHLAQTRVVLEQLHNNLQEKPATKLLETKEQDLDDMQAPLRARIGGYADETIRDGWGQGKKVSKENCAVFAAQVLVYVRKRFYAEVSKDEAAIRAAGGEPEMDPPNGPFSRKLTLESMKWIFDTKIKPHTEHYRKELFLCNDCEASKTYGFEGVIQHYAAKHTNKLSNGSVVVHWKSEWPEYTPFNPEPPTYGKSFHSLPHVPLQNAGIPYSVPPQTYGHVGISQVTTPATAHIPNPQMYQPSPVSYYGKQPYGDHFAQQPGPYSQPQPFSATSHGYQPHQNAVYPPIANAYGGPPQEYPTVRNDSQYPSTSQSYYPQQISHNYPTTISEVTNLQQRASYSYNEPNHNYAPVTALAQTESFAQPARSTSAVPAAVPEFKSEEYKAQLQDLGKNAKDIWDTLGGLKDVPGSVKAYTILYHILKRSAFNFPETPSLSMIVDGLSSNKDMRKVRNINGLQCKICVSGSSLPAQKKYFSFPQLVYHFQTVHDQSKSSSASKAQLDWTKNMISLPEASRYLSIANSQGLNDQTRKLISEALPDIFAPLQPVVETNVWSSENQSTHEPPPGQDNHEKYYSNSTILAEDSGNDGYDSSQYDPRRPIDMGDRRLHEESKTKSKLVLKRAEEYYPALRQDHNNQAYTESHQVSPVSHIRFSNGRSHYRDAEDDSQHMSRLPYFREEENGYHVRRDTSVPTSQPLDRTYRTQNIQSYRENRARLSPLTRDVTRHEIRHLPGEESVAKQQRIFDIVAQISEQAKQASERLPTKLDQIDIGSEDGELRYIEPRPRAEDNRAQPATEASDAADKFLSELIPSTRGRDAGEDVMDTGSRLMRVEDERFGRSQQLYQAPVEPQRRAMDSYEEGSRVLYGRGQHLGTSSNNGLSNGNGYLIRDHTPESRLGRAQQERYGPAPTRERSPELVDRRFIQNNVVYLDDRQGSHGLQRMPSSRFARYESVRLENDRARSRSPVYVKVGGSHHGQYRERSPIPHLSPQDMIYRARTPVTSEELYYERPLRHEYRRVYADESRPQPQYVEHFEYVRVADPQGDYMIRRPVRRGAEPVYTAYDSESYSRRPMYESRASVRAEPSYVEVEEYDPRHPAPPPHTMASHRYQ